MQVLAYTKFVFGCMGLYGDKSRHAGTWAVYGSALFTINFVVVTTTAFVLLCYDNPDLLVPIVFSLLYIVAFFVSGAFYFIEMLQRNAIFEALNDVQAIVNKRKFTVARTSLSIINSRLWISIDFSFACH